MNIGVVGVPWGVIGECMERGVIEVADPVVGVCVTIGVTVEVVGMPGVTGVSVVGGGSVV